MKKAGKKKTRKFLLVVGKSTFWAILSGHILMFLFLGYLKFGKGFGISDVPWFVLPCLVSAPLLLLFIIRLLRKKKNKSKAVEESEDLGSPQADNYSDRYQENLELLESTDLNTRLGAIDALEEISKGSPEHHWKIMEAFTAFIREKAAWRADTAGGRNLAGGEQRPAEDIQALLTVIGRRSAERRQIEPKGINLAQCDLRGAFFLGGHLEGAYLLGAHLEGAKLMDAHFQGANLCRAHLQGTVLGYAHLENANLKDAHLEGANLEEAFLEGADLRSDDLDRANLVEANFNSRQMDDYQPTLFPERFAPVAHGMRDLSVREDKPNLTELF